MDRQKLIPLLVVLLAVLALVGVALAGSGAVIGWDVLAGGGAPASGAPPFGAPPEGGIITLDDTLGQPVTGSSSGGNIDLSAGYWTGLTVEGKTHIYLPLILR